MIKQKQIYKDKNGFTYWISKIKNNIVYMRFSVDGNCFLKGTREELQQCIDKGDFILQK